jgi:hypothetical protein
VNLDEKRLVVQLAHLHQTFNKEQRDAHDAITSLSNSVKSALQLV